MEALLGVRMPRRPLFSHQGMKWFDRLKALLTDKVTWLMMVYMLVQFVLGTVYFVLMVERVECLAFIDRHSVFAGISASRCDSEQ